MKESLRPQAYTDTLETLLRLASTASKPDPKLPRRIQGLASSARIRASTASKPDPKLPRRIQGLASSARIRASTASMLPTIVNMLLARLSRAVSSTCCRWMSV